MTKGNVSQNNLFKTIGIIGSLLTVIMALISMTIFLYSFNTKLDRVLENQKGIDMMRGVIVQNTQAINGLRQAVVFWKDSQQQMLNVIVQLQTKGP